MNYKFTGTIGPMQWAVDNEPPRCSGVAVVVGTAPEMWDDLSTFRSYGIPADYITVNAAGTLIDNPRHHVGIDLPDGREDIPASAETVSCWGGLREDQVEACITHRWQITPRLLKMSGPFAVALAIAMGYELVVMVGSGMYSIGHVDGVSGGHGITHIYRDRWACGTLTAWFIRGFRDRVRSMSGATNASFGALSQGDIDRWATE